MTAMTGWKGMFTCLCFTSQPRKFWVPAAAGPLCQLRRLETVQSPPRGRRGRPRGRLEAVLEAVPRGRRKTQAILQFLVLKEFKKLKTPKFVIYMKTSYF